MSELPGRPPECAGKKGVHQTVLNLNIFQSWVGKVGLADHLHRPANDGFLNSLQPHLAVHDELAEEQYEVTFQLRRVSFLRAVEVDIQKVLIVSTRWRQLDYLTT